MFEKLKKYPWLSYATLFVILGVYLCVMIYKTDAEIGPPPFELSAAGTDYLKGAAAGLAALGLITLILVQRFRPQWLEGATKIKAAFKVAAVLLIVYGALAYFYSNRGLAQRDFLKFHDLYHYYLGLKYFPEVGYNDFYECHLRADQERRRPRFRDRDRVRDLDTYRIRTAREIRRGADCSGFSEERWEEFRHDIDVFDRYTHRGVLRDHGYNGTPFHARVAGAIANLPEVSHENLLLMSFIDIFGLCLLLAVLCWGFGWQGAFLFALILFTNFADRFYFISASFFRYQWLITLGLGLACMKRQRYGAAAVLMVLSAMLNVFPLLYFAGLGIKMLFQLVRERRLEKKYKTFLAWATGATVICAALSLTHDRPVERYETFFSNMSMHSGLLTRSRIGFRYNFMYRGEVTEDDPRYSYSRKAEELRRLYPIYIPLTAVILVLGLLIARRLDDVRASVLSGFLLFFMIFSTVEYYYASAAVLALLWVDELHLKRGKALAALFFALMGSAYLIWSHSQYLRFMNNHVLSGLFTIQLAATLIYFARTTGMIGKHSFLWDQVLEPIGQWMVAKIPGGKKNLWRGLKILIGIGLLVLAATLYSRFTPEELGRRGRGEYHTLLATGDTVLARRMHFSYHEHGARWPLRGLHERISEADISLTNLESVVAAVGDLYPKDGYSPYYFRGRPGLLDILTTAGFDVLATANNHAMDFGPAALLQQREIIDAAGMTSAGSGRDRVAATAPAYLRVDELTVAFISMYVGGGDMAASRTMAGVFQVERDREVLAAVREPYEVARQHADLVVFTPHWGGNNTENPDGSRISLAHDLIDLGFDAIMGHSAHQLHGMEIYDNRPIIYDMGNFLADWVSGPRMANAAMFELEFDRRGFSAVRVIPIRLDHGRTRPAEDDEAEATRDLFVELTEQLGEQLPFERDGQELVLSFAPNGQRAAHVAEPEEVHRAGSTRPVPERFTELPDAVELDEPPPYTEGFEPIEMEPPVNIIGVKTVEVFHRRSGFLLEVALKARGSFRGRWDAVVLAKRRGGGEFSYPHPISHGTTSPEQWEAGQVVLDRICVRPRPRPQPGTWDIYWALRNRQNRRLHHTRPEPGERRGEPAKIATIQVVNRGVSRRASGIEWDGQLPDDE